MTKRAERAVRERTVAWNPDLGDSGGFQWADGRRIDDLPLLIALWSGKQCGWFEVDGGVVLTAGRRS